MSLVDRISSLSDEDLLLMVCEEAKDYTNDALKIANNEIEKRGLTVKTVEEVSGELEYDNKRKDDMILRHSSLGIASCIAFLIACVVFAVTITVFRGYGHNEGIFLIFGMPSLLIGLVFGILGLIIGLMSRQVRILLCIIGLMLNSLPFLLLLRFI